MNPAPGVALRVAAAQTLDAVVEGGHSLKAELAQTLPKIADPRGTSDEHCRRALRLHSTNERSPHRPDR